MVKRWTAYKIEIADIIKAVYSEEGFIVFNNQQIQRVRILGTIVARFFSDERTYGFIVLDDGTETIRVKAYKEQASMLEDLNVGDIVEVFGRVKEYEDEIYLVPENIVHIEDPNWEILRKFELAKQKEEENNVQYENQKEKTETLSNEELDIVEEMIESPRQKIMDLIQKLDKGEGTLISELKTAYGDETAIETTITELMNEGEIFEPRPGKVKLLI